MFVQPFNNIYYVSIFSSIYLTFFQNSPGMGLLPRKLPRTFIFFDLVKSPLCAEFQLRKTELVKTLGETHKV